MKAVHKAVGAYTLCGRYLRDTMLTGDNVTCKYCLSGGIGQHKYELKKRKIEAMPCPVNQVCQCHRPGFIMCAFKASALGVSGNPNDINMKDETMNC